MDGGVLDLPEISNHLRYKVNHAVPHGLVFRYESFEKESKEARCKARRRRVFVVIIVFTLFYS